jgi:hypothetical protein
MVAMALGFCAVWFYAILRPGILDERFPRNRLGTATFRFSIGAVGYVCGPLLALWQPLAAVLLFGMLSFYYAFEHLPAPASAREAQGVT